MKKIILTTLVSASLLIDNTAFAIENNIQLSDKQDLHLSLTTMPPTLDPNLAYDTTSSDLLLQMFEPLIEYNAKTKKYVPAAAESYTLSADRKTWTFKLRKNAVWSDGKPVTANDFVYSWRRIVDPKTASNMSGYLSNNLQITNAQEIISGKAPITSLGIKAIDDYTLQITTTNYVPWFLSAVSYVALSPVRKDIIEKFADTWTQPQHIVVNGPFIVSKYIVNEVINLNKNNKYRDNKDVILQKINYNIVPSSIASYRRYQAHDLDMVSIPKQIFEDVLASKQKITTAKTFVVAGLLLNVNNPKLKNPKVREAIKLVIDNKLLAEKVIRANSTPTYFLAPKTVQDSQDLQNPPFSKELMSKRISQANKLISDAGYTIDKPLKLNMLYPTSDIGKTNFVAYSNQI